MHEYKTHPNHEFKKEVVAGAVIRPWSPQEAAGVYTHLEVSNWAPWLAASADTIAARSQVFASGQLLMKSNGFYLASLSMNQIHWDGDPQTLPSWDDVAGDPTDYSTTYQPDGNTLVLMSMNVNTGFQGLHLPTHMIHSTQKVAAELGIEHIIGSFRPIGFGGYKKEHGHDASFWDYCTAVQPDTGKPIDLWLRSLSWNGLKLLKEDPAAMTVTVGSDEFFSYQKLYPWFEWTQPAPGIWECGQVGQWVVHGDTAVYQESNVWGSLPLA